MQATPSRSPACIEMETIDREFTPAVMANNTWLFFSRKACFACVLCILYSVQHSIASDSCKKSDGASGGAVDVLVGD